MKKIAKFLGISLIGVPTVGYVWEIDNSLVGSTLYLYPDLRNDPY